MVERKQEYLIKNIERYEEYNSEEKIKTIYKVIFTSLFAGLAIYGYQNVVAMDNVEPSLGKLFAILVAAGHSVAGIVSIIKGLAKQLKIHNAINETELELKLTEMNQQYYNGPESRGRSR